MQAFRENAQRNDEARGFDGASPNMVAKGGVHEADCALIRKVVPLHGKGCLIHIHIRQGNGEALSVQVCGRYWLCEERFQVCITRTTAQGRRKGILRTRVFKADRRVFSA